MKENPFQDADVSTESTFNVNNVKNIKEDGSLQGINYIILNKGTESF